MYLRASRSGNHTYLRLVESYRDASGRTRQRQIAQLGRADQLSAEQVDGLIAGLLKATGRDMPHGIEGTAHFEPSLELGRCWLLSEIWQELGLDRALKGALRSSYRRFDAEALVRIMVFNRLCDPDSKLGVLDWLKGVVIPGVETSRISHQQLLRAMDALIENRGKLDDAFAGLMRPLIDTELSVVFYDLTTIRIHGETEMAGDIRRYGYSKDVDGVARQFVLGVIQTADGLPLAFEVFEGNVSETTTLLPMVERCLARYPIRRVVLVADRGLLSLDNLEALEAVRLSNGEALQYILAVPAMRYADFAERIASLRFSDDEPSVRECRHDDRRLVVAHDPQMASAKRERRQARLDELMAFGDQLAEKLDRQESGAGSRGRRASDRGAYARFTRRVFEEKLSRYVTVDLEADRFTFELNRPALDKAELLDGKLVLLTNVPKADIDAQGVVDRYKALADIERGFRVLKSDIEIAPVYHRLPDRIRAHAFICFLALVLNRVLRMRVRSTGAATSVTHALNQLRSIQLHRVRAGNQELKGLTTLTQQQMSLFADLKVQRPSQDRL